LNVKPGLTGEWQVNGRSSVKDFYLVYKMTILWHLSTGLTILSVFSDCYKGTDGQNGLGFVDEVRK